MNTGIIQQDSNNSIDQLKAFVTSMNVYHRIVEALPISETLSSLLDDYNFSNLVNQTVTSEDFVGVMVRLMLQRKHFQRSDSIGNSNPQHIRQLLKTSAVLFPDSEETFSQITRSVDQLAQRYVELATPNGQIKTEYHTGIEDVVYGALLHNDVDRIKRIAGIPDQMLTIYVAPLVVGRENIMNLLFSSLIRSGIKGFDETEATYGPSFSLERGEGSRQITQSPYWSNLIGKDADEEAALGFISRLPKDELEVYETCMLFMDLLRENPIDKGRLRKLVSLQSRCQWGDFSEAALRFSEVKSPAISSHVKILEKGNSAVVKVLSHVDAPFIVDTPQVIGCGTITLFKQFGKWRIHEMSVPKA